jgi:hypothetical protein
MISVLSKVEVAYRRGDLLEKRKMLMQAWSDYCSVAPMVQEASDCRKWAERRRGLRRNMQLSRIAQRSERLLVANTSDQRIRRHGVMVRRSDQQIIGICCVVYLRLSNMGGQPANYRFHYRFSHKA